MAITIVGISGKKGSGKDEVCKILRSIWGEERGERIAFADALKEELATACGVSLEDISRNKSDYRTGLQWWGTGFRRRFFGQDYWIKQFLNKLILLPQGTRYVICTDVRFFNEAEIIREIGGTVWRIDRARFDHGVRQELSDILDTHPSETELDTYPHFQTTIRNHGTLENLRQEVETALDMLNMKKTI